MTQINTKLIGYFRPAGDVVYTEDENRWPIIKKMDLSGTPDKDAIADYLDNGQYACGYRGWSQCRICGCKNGSQELTDGTYEWPAGLGHYVRDHGLVLPEEVLQHIRGTIAGTIPKVEVPEKLPEGKLFRTRASLDWWEAWAKEKGYTEPAFPVHGFEERKRSYSEACAQEIAAAVDTEILDRMLKDL